MKKALSIIVLVLCFAVASAENPDFGRIPEHHPRLFLKSGDEKAINRMLKSKENRFLLEQHYHCLDIADKALTEKNFKFPGPGHILSTSRNIQRRVFNLAYAFRMTGDWRYAKRAEEEMLSACEFPSWDPDHFLDTAEMMTAMAVGYDWLYDYFDEGTKDVIASAILEKGLNTAELSNFYVTSNNWNSVCNAGMVAAALAIYERIPEEAQKRIGLSIKSNPLILDCYGPDGVYPEGYSYWNYGNTYEAILIQLLRDNLGSDFGLSEFKGFMQTGWFVPFMMTPTWHTFSFSDSGDETLINPILCWFSMNTSDPTLLYLEKRHINEGKISYGIEDRYLPLMLLYCSRQDLSNITVPSKNFYYSYGQSASNKGKIGKGNVPLFIYRSGWDSREDTYLAAKGGQPNFSHGHMDIGEFYFEKGGVIWAKDLGTQSYGTFYKNNVACWDFSQDGDRWGIWRYCTLTHNVLTVNGGRQVASSFSPLLEVWTDLDRKGCSIDISPAYALQLDSAKREILLTDNDNKLTITDFIINKNKEAEVYWNMTTMAGAEIVSSDAILLSSGKSTMLMKVVEPKNVEMSILSSKSPYSWDVPNPGSCRVGFKTRIPASASAVLKVELTYQSR